MCTYWDVFSYRKKVKNNRAEKTKHSESEKELDESILYVQLFTLCKFFSMHKKTHIVYKFIYY